VLVVSVFGWKGGKQLVEQSYADAKVKVAEKKAAKRAARDDDAEDASSSAPRGGEPDA
jgi:hypothetical protein